MSVYWETILNTSTSATKTNWFLYNSTVTNWSVVERFEFQSHFIPHPSLYDLTLLHFNHSNVIEPAIHLPICITLLIHLSLYSSIKLSIHLSFFPSTYPLSSIINPLSSSVSIYLLNSFISLSNHLSIHSSNLSIYIHAPNYHFINFYIHIHPSTHP